MRVEFSKAIIPAELRSLTAFDHEVFTKPDWFPRQAWTGYDSFWMRLDGRKIGCCAFQEHISFEDDLTGSDRAGRGSLYIASTGILPKCQGMGFGRLLKDWQICYARYRGFKRLITNTRKSNSAMIALNRKFGFRIVRTTAGYYTDPVEPTVVMELILRPVKR